MPFSKGVSENSILFFQGGHKHDGVSSSLIDVTKYSIYDFIVGKTGDSARQSAQQRNYDSLKGVISSIITTDILGPSGVRLGPNSVQSVNISAGAVTASELAANIVLVNNIISSSNFDGTVAANGVITGQGTAGWAITSAGGAVFTNGLFRGSLEIGANDYWHSNGAFALGGNTGIYRNVGEGITLGANVTILGGVTASAVSTPGIDISSAGNLTSNANTFGIYANGAIFTSSGNFAVDAGGNLSANNASIAGTINATSGSIAGWSISDDMISAAGGGIYLYQEPGYGSVGAGTGAGQQILMNSEAELYAEFDGITTQINFQTDTAYVFRITDGSQFIKIAPLLVSAQVGASYSFLANDMIATTGEVSMDTASVNGIGIMYPGCTTGPGAFNYMGLVWDNPNIRGTVDNAVSAVLGTVSDIRSKVNIIDAPSDWALKTLNDLRVVEYNPINILNPDDKTEKPKRLGLIAQELADVFPELVTSVNADDPDAILSVDYLGLVPHLIQVIKLLNDKIESIEQRIGE